MKQILTDILNIPNESGSRTDLLYRFIDSLPMGIVIIHGSSFGANKYFYRMIGETKAFHSVETYLSACGKDYLFYNEFSSLLADSDSFTKIYPIKPLDGTEYCIENTTYKIEDEEKRVYYVCTLLDRTAMNTLSTQFDAYSERCRIIEELISDYIFEYDLSSDTLHFPERWKPDGVNTDFPHARKWLELHEIIHPDEMALVIDAMTSSRAFKEPRTLEFRARFLKEDYTWHQATYKLIRSRHDGILRAIGKIRSIDKERMLEGDGHPEGIDPRTGLLLPPYMQNCIDQLLEEDMPEGLCALMLLQLDNFSEFNKKTGDLYTRKIEEDVARKLKNSFRTTDILAYSQNGCYMVFLKKVPEHIITLRATHVLEAVRKINASIKEPVELTCSIGISLTPLDASNYMELFLKADSAMYLSKARGGNTFSFFNTEVDTRQRTAQS